MTHRRLATASALVPLAFAILALGARITGHLELASLRPGYIPMAGSTAIGFVLLGTGVVAAARGPGTAWRRLALICAAAVFMFGIMGILESIGSIGLRGFDLGIAGRSGRLVLGLLAGMSPLTGIAFALAGLALGCLTFARKVRDPGGVLGSFVGLMGTTVVLGYAYGAPLLYGGATVPMALTTGLAFVGAGVSLVALAGPDCLPLRPFFRGSVRAVVAESERKRAEKALHESEILARSLIEHLQQRIFVKDRSSSYVFCNSAFARDLGIEPPQIGGKTDFAFFPRDIAEAYRADDRAVMANGTIKDADERYEQAGEARWIHTTKVPYRDEQGEIIGVLGIFQDITDRKRAEADIRRHGELSAQAEREFRAMFASNPLPMWIYDLSSLQFLEVNEAATQRYGYSRDDFLAMTIKDIRPAEDVERLAAHLRRPRRAWEAAGAWRHRLKSGDIIDVDVTSHTITFAGRQAALVVAQDITERKRSVEALQVAEERTRFALQNANVGIWDMDYTTGVLRWSPILEAQYGLEPGTFGGTFDAFLERIHPDDRGSVLETLGKAMKNGSDFLTEHRSLWPDGTTRWLSGAGRIILDDRGQPVRGVGVAQDVTARKRADDELKHLADEIQLQRLRVFKATMRTVQDIVNNLLNGLQLAQLEGEGRDPAEVQSVVDGVIQDVAAKLKALGDLEILKEKEMVIGVGIDYPGGA